MKMRPLIHNDHQHPIPTGSLEMAVGGGGAGRNSSAILRPDLFGLTSVNRSWQMFYERHGH